MANLTSALQQLRAERREAQLQVEKLGRAISVIESLNGSGTSRQATQPTRIVSAASRRRMARAQKARWAKRAAANGQENSAKPRRTMSLAARRKIAAAQRARWARTRGQQKKAA
jgi:phage major head subunit gpT-like protein